MTQGCMFVENVAFEPPLNFGFRDLNLSNQTVKKNFESDFFSEISSDFSSNSSFSTSFQPISSISPKNPAKIIEYLKPHEVKQYLYEIFFSSCEKIPPKISRKTFPDFHVFPRISTLFFLRCFSGQSNLFRLLDWKIRHCLEDKFGGTRKTANKPTSSKNSKFYRY
eukprot:Sdes_comp19490_c0_seq4m10995